MRSLLVILFAFTLPLLGEYQAFKFQAMVTRVEPAASGGGHRVTDKLTGVMVGVSCYPCGADFGKGYQTWLFLKSRRAGSDTVFRIPFESGGMMFGAGVDPTKFSDMRWVQPTAQDKRLGARAQSSGVWIHFKTVATAGILSAQGGEVWLSGIGSAGVKTNTKTDDPMAVWNPYIRSVTGTLCGYALIPNVGFQPPNRNAVSVAPLCGDFKITYDSALTEALRGTADWDELARRVLSTMPHKTVIADPWVEGYTFSAFPLANEDD